MGRVHPRAAGSAFPSPAVRPDIKPHTVQGGDIYLLCSDGLYGSVPHGLIAEMMAATNAAQLDRTCADLIAAAKEHGSRDNITALLMAC